MSEWKEYKFRELLEEPVRSGIYKKKEYHGRGTKIVNMGELFALPRLTSVEMKRVEINKSERSKCLLRNGDLIFARRSLTAEGAGKCSLVYKINEDVTFESSIIRAKPNQSKASSEFLYYYFNSPYGKYLLGTILRQVAVSGITGTDLMDLVLNIPNKETQINIAEVFSNLDDKIDLLHRQNKTLEQLAETLFRKWFVEEADESWDKKPLKDVCTIINGFAFKSEDYKEYGRVIVRTMNFNNGFIDLKNVVYISFEKENNYQKFLLKRFDFLLVMVGASLGKYSIVTSDILPALQNQNMWNFRAIESFSQHYLNFAIRTIIIENLGSASGSAREFFQKGQFYEFLISIPDENKINAFDALFEEYYSKIEFNRSQIRTLTQLRDTLLPKLMSGEVRVRIN